MDYVRSCPSSQHSKLAHAKLFSLLTTVQIPDRRAPLVFNASPTFLLPLQYRHESIVVIVERLSKRVDLEP